MPYPAIHLTVLVLALTLPLSAAEFRNLTFDEANTNRVQGNLNLGTMADLLPGWGLSFRNGAGLSEGTNGSILFNESQPELLNSSAVFSAGQDYFPESLRPYFSLPYYVVLETHAMHPNVDVVDFYRLHQVGTMPMWARTVEFTCVGGQFSLKLGGNQVPLTYQAVGQISWRSTFTTVWRASGDVSSFAGQELELSLGTSTRNTLYIMDSVQFIPEPSALWLFGLGLPFFLWVNRRRGR